MILEEKFNILSSNPENTFHHAVYKSDGKQVTIKRVSFVNMSSKDKKKLINEVNILMGVKCSNIVKYYDYFINKQKMELYIIMEYCAGGSLKQNLEMKRTEGNRFEEKAIWKIFSQVVLAVSEIHNDKSGPILHRNIAPSSIFLDQDYNFKLGNFSFIRKLDPSQTFAETYLPNVSYLSPEQITDGIFTLETDIWQLGCLLYEITCLKPPFRSSSDFVRAQKIRSAEIQPIPSCYSSQLNRVIRFCLNKQLKKRPTIQTLISIPEINNGIRKKRLYENIRRVEEKEKMLKRKQMEIATMEQIIKKMEEELRRQDELQNLDGKKMMNTWKKDSTNETNYEDKQNIYNIANIQKNRSEGYGVGYTGFKNNSMSLKKAK